MKRMLPALLLLTLLSGCLGGIEARPGDDSAAVQNSEMAYVLFAVKGGTSTGWTNTAVHYDEWKNHEYVNISPGSGTEYEYRLVMLVPGTYTMTRYLHIYGSSVFEMNSASKKQNEQVKHSSPLFGSFTVEQGKINYLGDINSNLRLPQGKPILEIKDNRSGAAEFLRNRYPNIDLDLLIYAPIMKGPFSE